MSVQVFINSVNRSSLIKMGSLSIEDQINQATDTASFSIDKKTGDTFVPVTGDEVWVNVNSVRKFGGTIIKVKSSSKSLGLVEYDVKCKDFSHFMDRKTVLRRYENQSLQAIVEDLISTYAGEFGFTFENVEGADVNIRTAGFTEIPVSECLDRLARLTGFLWYVDAFKDVHFFKKMEEDASFFIQEGPTVEATSNNFIFETLELEDDFSQIRNRIKIIGGEARSDERTESLAGDGERDTFPLGNKFAEVPVVTVNGTPVDVGVEYLQDETQFDVMWSFSQKYLRFTEGNIPSAPGSGTTNINVTGIPLRPIVVQRGNSVSINTFGVYEHTIQNDSLRSRDEALQFAANELSQYANAIRAGSFQTYQMGIHSGDIVEINSHPRGLNEGFIVQSVRFRQISPTRFINSIEVATIKTVSMVDLLQQILLRGKLALGDDETQIVFIELSDAFSMSDSIVSITTQPTQDYIVEQNDPGSDSYPQPAIVNKSTMSV